MLIVDDFGPNRALLTAWLESEYRIATAADGQAALDMLDTVQPDVVLLDVMMPGVDGFETCRRIKHRCDLGFVPVVLLTALEDQASRNAGLEAGADDFLSRPVDPNELALRVGAFARLRRQDLLIRQQLEEQRRLDTLKEDLVALVSHDLLNALSGLMVMMESIQMTRGTCGPEELKSLLAAAGRMHVTLEDMLRVKQLGDGALRLDRVPVPLTQVVDGALAFVNPTLRARGLTVTRHVDPRIVVEADVVLLERSLFNLLQNAVKYSPRGESVEIAALIRDGQHLVVEVRDRGPGVPEEIRAHLFEKYAGVGARRTAGPTGHGLGLFLVQLVARAHGGGVQVDARADGGTTFRIVMPLRVSQ